MWGRIEERSSSDPSTYILFVQFVLLSAVRTTLLLFPFSAILLHFRIVCRLRSPPHSFLLLSTLTVLHYGTAAFDGTLVLSYTIASSHLATLLPPLSPSRTSSSLCCTPSCITLLAFSVLTLSFRALPDNNRADTVSPLPPTEPPSSTPAMPTYPTHNVFGSTSSLTV